MFISVPSLYFYYPISSLRRSDESGYQTQIFVASSQSVDYSKVKEVIKEYFHSAEALCLLYSHQE